MNPAEDHKYDDIIHLSRPVSTRHAPMSPMDRAAQFSPFAALTGYEAVIDEAGRLTENGVELMGDGVAMVDEQLRLIGENIRSAPSVVVTWFRPDDRKSGGAYVTTTGHVVKIDPHEHFLLFADGMRIPLSGIHHIAMDE